MSWIVQLVTGRRSAWGVALVGLLLGVGIIAGVGQAERDPGGLDTLPAGYDSTQGQALLDELPDEGSRTAIVLFTGDDLAERLPELGALLGQVDPEGEGASGGTGGPTGEGKPEGEGDSSLVPSEDGSAAFGVLQIDGPTASETADQVEQLRTDLAAAVPAGVTAQVTGPAGIEADLASVFDGANLTLLAVTASVVAVLLILTYRSPVLWIVPLAVVGLADQVAAAAATHVLRAAGIPWDESTVGILSVLVFGAGTNYALLLISRYRDELSRRDSRHEAMGVALRRAAEAIVASASTVVVGVLCLLLSVVPTTRGLGLACAVGVVVAMLLVLLVLPAALVLCGRWIFWPRVPHAGHGSGTSARSVWRRIGDTVAAAPGRWVVASLLVLGAAAAGLTQVRSGLSLEDQFLETPEAITAAQRLAESFPAGIADPLVVVTRTDDAAEVDRLATRVGEVDGVSRATAVPPVEGIGRVQVVLDADPGSERSRDIVGQVRTAVTGTPDTHVTGGDASTLDEAAGSIRDRWVVMPLILGAVLLALAALLRSLLAPVLLVASVVATYAAALGMSWWLFRFVLGFDAIDASMPLLAFVFLVALGVDYNIFLITRTLEEAGVHGTREGVLRALGATGGVITSAGVLLAAVFAVLGVLPLVVLAQIGVVICIGVLLDTLLVRTILVPAVVRLLGERFWWPRRATRAV